MIKKYIKREFYLNKIKPYIDKNIIKIIVGQRRVGKSYFIYQLMDFIKDNGVQDENIIYINKELVEFNFIKDYTDLIKYVETKAKTKKKIYLFIDEVQEIENFEKALRSFSTDDRYDIYCTGSNADLLSSEISTLLAGRFIEIKIYSLSYREFLKFHKIKDNEDSFLKYIKFGGLPYLINLKLEENIVYDYLRGIYNTILFKDIVKRYNIRNINFIENLIEYVSINTGSIVSAKKISDFLKSQRINISPNIVLEYLHYLTKAYFIFKVRRSDINGKKIFEIGEKYYFEDLGLRHTVIGYKQNDINKILENIVFLHLAIAGYNITVGKIDGNKVDFICKRGEQKLYVQVSYLMVDEKIRHREFGNLLKIKDNYPKLVVSMDSFIGGTYEGIKQMNIRDFLLNFLN